MGRSLRNIALWAAERGEKLGVLEQLMGSVSIFGTFTAQISLWRGNIVSAVLVPLWMLSPLGGQAALRLMGVRLHGVTIQQRLNYMSYEQPSLLEGNLSSSALNAINALYTTAIGAQDDKPHTYDQWGNIKIPFLESLNIGNRDTSTDLTHNKDQNGWTLVPIRSRNGLAYTISVAVQEGSEDAFETLGHNVVWGTYSPVYTSFLGIPTSAFMDISKNGTFTMISSYYLLNCSNMYNTSIQTKFTSNGSLSRGWTSYGASVPGQSFSIGTDIAFSESRRGDPRITPRTMLFQWSVEPGIYTVSKCTITQSYVRSLVACNTTYLVDAISCAVIGMQSAPPPLPIALTPLENYTTCMNFFTNFATATLSANAVSLLGAAYDADKYLPNYTIGYKIPPYLEGGVWPFAIQTLHWLVNTYWLATLAPEYIQRPSSIPSHEGWINSNDTIAALGPIPKTETATVQSNSMTSAPVYVCHVLWLFCLLLSSTVLLMVGIVGVIVKYRSVSPEILGYVSSHTRDNPYVDLPPGGTTMEGLKRSRVLFDTRVRLQDVKEDKEVGHIALASYDGQGRSSNLMKGRLYV